MLTLPPPPAWSLGLAGPCGCVFFRGPGPDFFRPRTGAVLTLLRPHLPPGPIFDAERHRPPRPPRLTSRQNRPAAPGRGRAHQHPDRPPGSAYIRRQRLRTQPREHLQAGCRFSGRTAAVTPAAFQEPDGQLGPPPNNGRPACPRHPRPGCLGACHAGRRMTRSASCRKAR